MKPGTARALELFAVDLESILSKYSSLPVEFNQALELLKIGYPVDAFLMINESLDAFADQHTTDKHTFDSEDSKSAVREINTFLCGFKELRIDPSLLPDALKAQIESLQDQDFKGAFEMLSDGSKRNIEIIILELISQAKLIWIAYLCNLIVLHEKKRCTGTDDANETQVRVIHQFESLVNEMKRVRI